METLQQKIKSVIAKTGMTYKDLAKKLGVSKDNLYKWKGSSNPRNYQDYEKLNKGLDKILENSSETMAHEPGEKYITGYTRAATKPLMVSIFLEQDEEPELYIDEKAIPGTITRVKGKPALIAWRNESAVIGNVDGLIPISGDSMAPEFKSGSWIAVTKLKFKNILVTGSYYYVIDQNNQGILRKIKIIENGKSIELIAAIEEKAPPFVIGFEDIVAIFKVEAVLTRL